jgi:di/tricarboxylate transporter
VRSNVEKIRQLEQQVGIVLKSGIKWRDEDLQSAEAVLVEAVIAPNSRLEGQSLKGTNFRNTFGATALAIRHRGETMHERLGNAALRAGDVLLIEVARDRLKNLKDNPAFVIVSEVGLPEFRTHKVIPALAIVFAVVVVATLNIMPIVATAIIGSVMLVLAGCITLEEAYNSIDWKIIFLLAGVLSLGIALEKTGTAELLSSAMVRTVGAWGPAAVASSFYLLASLLTASMSNNATAALLAPIAIATAIDLNVDARPLLMAVTFAASASFITPVGYQTNMLIYGPGQYKFADFFRVGAPLNLVFWLLATWLIPRFWPF